MHQRQLVEEVNSDCGARDWLLWGIDKMHDLALWVKTEDLVCWWWCSTRLSNSSSPLETCGAAWDREKKPLDLEVFNEEQTKSLRSVDADSGGVLPTSH